MPKQNSSSRLDLFSFGNLIFGEEATEHFENFVFGGAAADVSKFNLKLGLLLSAGVKLRKQILFMLDGNYDIHSSSISGRSEAREISTPWVTRGIRPTTIILIYEMRKQSSP
tara:strand:+ start:740 stop:1075 length:336 start_codon:yes stop_codon:yes gene_type:complete